MFSFSNLDPLTTVKTQESLEISEFPDDFFLDFDQNKAKIKILLRNLVFEGPELEVGSFPTQKIKKNPIFSNDYNYQANIFKRNLNRSQILDLSTSRIISPEEKSEKTLEKLSSTSNILEKMGNFNENEKKNSNEKLEFLKKKNSGENPDFFSNIDEFNTLERKKIHGFDSSYTFDNNTNNISKLESSFNYKSIEKNIENSAFLSPNPKNDDFESFLQEFNKKTVKKEEKNESFSQKIQNKEEFHSFREKSAIELKDIKQQMRSLETNLNSILEKLNQQIQNSKLEINTKTDNSPKIHEKDKNITKATHELKEIHSPLIEKKVLVVQKRKDSLQPCESPLKARVNRETHSLSRNMSNFCKNVLQEANVLHKTEGKSPNNDDYFNALNRFKRYEEEQSFEVSHFNIQNHFDLITKDVLKKNGEYQTLGLKYKGNFDGGSPILLRKGSEIPNNHNNVHKNEKKGSITPGRKTTGQK